MYMLLEGERGFLGATHFYQKLSKLGVPVTLYELPSPFIFKPEEVLYWTSSMLNDLIKVPYSEDKQYVLDICYRLQAWAEKGYVIHILKV